MQGNTVLCILYLSPLWYKDLWFLSVLIDLKSLLHKWQLNFWSVSVWISRRWALRLLFPWNTFQQIWQLTPEFLSCWVPKTSAKEQSLWECTMHSRVLDTWFCGHSFNDTATYGWPACSWTWTLSHTEDIEMMSCFRECLGCGPSDYFCS